MAAIADLTDRQKLHVLGSEKYSIRHGDVFDDVIGRHVNADEITEDE